MGGLGQEERFGAITQSQAGGGEIAFEERSFSPAFLGMGDEKQAREGVRET